MANKKLSELTEVTEITNDNTLVYLVDPTRAAGDKSVGINKTNLQTAIGGGGALVSKTGTSIVFTEDALYNEITFLTSGNLTLDLTGAIKGTVVNVYCDRYIPTITGTNYISSGEADATKLNIFSFFYDGTSTYLNIGVVEYVAEITPVITIGNTELILNWSSITNADTYVIERSLDNFATAGTEVYSGSLLTFTDTGLTNGTTYYYRGKTQGNGFLDSDFGTITSATPAVSVYLANLVAEYQYNNDLLDSSGNGYNGTGVGTIAYTTGLINNALQLQNNDSYLTVSDVDDLTFGSGDFSYVTLVRWQSIPTQGNALASKRGAGANDKEYYIFLNGTGTTRYQVVLYTDGANFVNIEYNNTPTLNQWYVVGVTSDGTAAGTRLYIDGVEVETGTGFETGTYTGMPNTTNDLFIGADSQSPTGTDIDAELNRTYFWKGREMSAAEMLDISDELLAGNDIL